MTLVKICGIREPDHALAAAQAGADFIGLVFAPSHRQVSVEEAQAVARALGGRPLAAVRPAPTETPTDLPGWFRERAQEIESMLRSKRPLLVGVFADAERASIHAIAMDCGLDLVQLSGHETWEACRGLARPVIKALRVGPGASAESVLENMQAGTAHLCLLDSDVRGALGGSGQTFDWSIAAEVARRFPIVFAGGLTPENVGEAVQRVRPWAVDVSSGVETEGIKDVAKIRAFIAAAKEVEG
jgi:phosphoribosylanthranilate isomerase